MTKICICGHKKSDHARWVNDNQCLICNAKARLNKDGTFTTVFCDNFYSDLVWLKFSSRTSMANSCISEETK